MDLSFHTADLAVGEFSYHERTTPFGNWVMIRRDGLTLERITNGRGCSIQTESCFDTGILHFKPEGLALDSIQYADIAKRLNEMTGSDIDPSALAYDKHLNSKEKHVELPFGHLQGKLIINNGYHLSKYLLRKIDERVDAAEPYHWFGGIAAGAAIAATIFASVGIENVPPAALTTIMGTLITSPFAGGIGGHFLSEWYQKRSMTDARPALRRFHKLIAKLDDLQYDERKEEKCNALREKLHESFEDARSRMDALYCMPGIMVHCNGPRHDVLGCFNKLLAQNSAPAIPFEDTIPDYQVPNNETPQKAAPPRVSA